MRGRPLLVPTTLAALATTAPQARAEDLHASIGITVGLAFGDGEARLAFGFDFRLASIMALEGTGEDVWGVGPFFNLLATSAYARLATGVHVGRTGGTTDYDGELGWTWMPETGSGGGHGVHVGAVINWYLLEAHIRGGVHFGEKVSSGGSVGLGLRIPPLIGDSDRYGEEGRPLRIAGRVVYPSLRPAARSIARHDATDDPGTREALTLAWLNDARSEASSIPTFEGLAHQLRSHGAPARLVRRASTAARDERVHASLCARLAERHSGIALAPTRLAPTRQVPPLDQMVRDAWHDGVLGEGAAALRAAYAGRRARDPIARATLARIAQDESNHARRVGYDPLRARDRPPRG